MRVDRVIEELEVKCGLDGKPVSVYVIKSQGEGDSISFHLRYYYGFREQVDIDAAQTGVDAIAPGLKVSIENWPTISWEIASTVSAFKGRLRAALDSCKAPSRVKQRNWLRATLLKLEENPWAYDMDLGVWTIARDITGWHEVTDLLLAQSELRSKWVSTVGRLVPAALVEIGQCAN